jgi:hypothetical protein
LISKLFTSHDHEQSLASTPRAFVFDPTLSATLRQVDGDVEFEPVARYLSKKPDNPLPRHDYTGATLTYTPPT